MENKKHIIKYSLIAFLLLVSLLSSIVLSTNLFSKFCLEGKGCDVVQGTDYAYTLGVKNSVYGVIVFSLLLVLSLLHLFDPDNFKERIIRYSIIAGSAVALYFLYLQSFVIKSFCKYCLVVDFSLILALVIILVEIFFKDQN